MVSKTNNANAAAPARKSGMARSRGGHRLRGLLMGTAVMALLPAYQEAPGAPDAAQLAASPVVQRVVVEGNQRIEGDTVRSYLPIRPGQSIDQLTIDTALKSLFGTGLFADAQIVFDPATGVLAVGVEENPIVNRVIYEGNKRTKEDKFTEEVQLEPRAVYTQSKVQSDVARILEIYRQTGRFGATVVPKLVQLPQNRVDVIFEIEEGPKTGVAKVNFIGNEVFTDSDLRGAILTAESRWWDILESNDNYDPARLDFDRQQLREFYTKQGYADFSVVSAVAELTPDRKDFFITFTVEEGPQYTFGKVEVRAALDKIADGFLERSLPVRSGQQFNSELIDKSEEAITFSTGIAGYAFVDVRPNLSVNRDSQTVDITFDVNEGPRVYVERIDIGGNSQTLDKVIRREMRLSEGDAFNRVLLERSERGVQRLGYFSEVNVEELPGSAPDRTVIDVKVVEQPTGSLQVGGGLSSADNFIINAQVEQRNLLGKGQYLLLDLSASSRTRRAQVRFTEPRFLSRNLLAGFSVFANRTDFREAGFVSDSIGGGVNVSFPVSDFGRLSLNYLVKNDDIQFNRPIDVVDGITPFPDAVFDDQGRVDQCDTVQFSVDPSCDSRGEFLTSQLGYGLSLNRVDNPIRPSSGFRVSVNQTIAGLGGDVQFLKTSATGAAYKALPYDLVGAFKFNLGYVDGFGDDGVRLNDRFFVGGNRGFRGFDVAGVGPRFFQPNLNGLNPNRQGDDFGRAIGAKALAIGTFEIALPERLIPEQYGIRAALFTDFGAVGLIDEDDKLLNADVNSFGDPNSQEGALVCFVNFNRDDICDAPVQDAFAFRATAGISVNWNSPFGPVQIDLAEPIRAEPFDEVQKFRFSAGRQF